MNVNAITRRLDALQQIASRSGPVHMTVTFAGRSPIITDYGEAWAIVRDPVMCEDVVTITASRSDYAAAAGIMTVLCHPVSDRRIEDFE